MITQEQFQDVLKIFFNNYIKCPKTYYSRAMRRIDNFYQRFLKQNQANKSLLFENAKEELQRDLNEVRKIVVKYYDTIFEYLMKTSEEYQYNNDFKGFMELFKSDHFLDVIHEPAYNEARRLITDMVPNIESKLSNYWGPGFYKSIYLPVGRVDVNSTDLGLIPYCLSGLDDRFRMDIKPWFSDSIEEKYQLCTECYRFYNDTIGCCLRCAEERRYLMESSDGSDY